MKILLVEDNMDTGASMTRWLETKGHEVIWVGRCSLAIITMEQVGPFDLAILDGELPDGRGPDLLPLPFPAVVCTGLPEDYADCGVPVFSKGDSEKLLTYIEEMTGG